MHTISVIIATCNRSDSLGKTLKSILGQVNDGTYSMDAIVVDNNSSDDTKNVVESFIPSFQGKLQYLFEEIRGKSHAVNKGIKAATGEIIAFTDDDTLVDAQWLSEIINCFRAQGCDGLGGRIMPKYPPHSPKWIVDNKDLIVGPVVYYDYGKDTKAYNKPMLEFLGANCAFKRSLFKEHGLFRTDIGPGHEVLGEDTEITNRFLNAGKKLCYCGEAFVWHPVEVERMTLNYITSWYVALGRYRIIVDQKNQLPIEPAQIFGVPVELAKRYFKEAFYLLTHIFNTRERLRAWVDLSTTYGKIKQIRLIRKSQALKP